MVPSLVVAAVLLLALWPTARSGARLLRTWGVAWPNEAQVAEAIRYLRQRRLLYVTLFLVLPPLVGLVWPGGSTVPGLGVFVPLLVAMLIAELLATLRPVSGVRVASLTPRSWRDLVPGWAVALTGLLVLLTVAFGAVVIASGERTGWVALGSGALCLVAVGIGIGFGWLGAAVMATTGRTSYAEGWLGPVAEVAGPVAQLGALLAWVWLTSPSRRSLAALPS